MKGSGAPRRERPDWAAMASRVAVTLTTLLAWLVAMGVVSTFAPVGRVEALLLLMMVIVGAASVDTGGGDSSIADCGWAELGRLALRGD